MASQEARLSRRALRAHQQRKHAQRKVLIRSVVTVTVCAVLAFGGLFVYNNLTDENTSAGDPLESVTVDGMSLGDPNAELVLIEYGDYYCHHCQDFALHGEDQLIADFIATGKIRFEFHPMPVLGGDVSDPANPSVRIAEASFAALAQNAYWPFHKAAFEKTSSAAGAHLTDEDILNIAKETVPNFEQFESDFASGVYRQQVLDSYNTGVSLGLSGVPSFVLDGSFIPWTSDGYDALKTSLEQVIR